MDAAHHRRDKQHISRIAPPIAGAGALPHKFPVVGTHAAAGVRPGVWFAVGELRMINRGLLVKHQNVLRLFQRGSVGVEKTRSPFLVPYPLIAEHGQVGRSQHLVIGALGKEQHRPVGLDRPFHRLPQLGERQRHIPVIPGGAIGRIGEQHINRVLGQGQQPLDPVHEV